MPTNEGSWRNVALKAVDTGYLATQLGPAACFDPKLPDREKHQDGGVDPGPSTVAELAYTTQAITRVSRQAGRRRETYLVGCARKTRRLYLEV